ncbi:MAG: haloacid dehalogenase-like hydrolase, partial [Acidimicrobiales bacterium]|nr:haloacid dehalogenase-like hydrolase [Acidimicrobiales bacterium]
MAPTPNELHVRALRKRVLLAFDFDETLAPNTTNALLEHLGENPEEFRDRYVKPLQDRGWESRLAEAHTLVELSRRRSDPITDQTFAEVASNLDMYPGVPDMFDRVRTAVGDIDDDIDVEFHMITAGFVNIPSHTAIADEFTSIIGGHWAFDEAGQIVFPKNTVGHYAKVRHLLALAKGIDSVQSDRSYDIDRDIPESEWHAPFEQIIFVGDGDSDLPAFDFMQSHAGTAIAVYQADNAREWESKGDMRRGR